MEKSAIDDCAILLTQICLSLPVYHSRTTDSPTIQDTRPIVERWVGAPGWDGQADEVRAEALTRFVEFLHQLAGDRLPLEWLLFPSNAAISLQTQTSTYPALEGCRREQCAAALRCFGLALQDASRVPASCTGEEGVPLTNFVTDCDRYA